MQLTLNISIFLYISTREKNRRTKIDLLKWCFILLSNEGENIKGNPDSTQNKSDIVKTVTVTVTFIVSHCSRSVILLCYVIIAITAHHTYIQHPLVRDCIRNYVGLVFFYNFVINQAMHKMYTKKINNAYFLLTSLYIRHFKRTVDHTIVCLFFTPRFTHHTYKNVPDWKALAILHNTYLSKMVMDRSIYHL